MLRFWLALILGTIVISAGLTYLKLHRGAQTIPYPPLAPKTKQPAVEFIPAKANTPENNMEVSANLVLFHVSESIADADNEIEFKVRNNGEGPLELSYKGESCTCAHVYVDGQRVSGTNHMSKINGGQTATFRIIYKPKITGTRGEPEKKRIRVTFDHNDQRYSDNLQFEIVTTVKPGKG